MKWKYSLEKERVARNRHLLPNHMASFYSRFVKKKINFVLEQVAARRRWRHRKIIRPFYISLRYRVYT